MAEIATAIGRQDDAARYTARLAANRKAYHQKFFNNREQGGTDLLHRRCCYDKGSQTSNMMALHLGAVPPEYVNATLGMLIASIRNRTSTSPNVIEKNQNIEAAAGAVSSSSAAGSDIAQSYDPSLPAHWLQDATHRVGTPGPTPFGAGPHLDCGIFGTTFVFEVLHKHGADAVAIDLLKETSYPSFGHMIENAGARTADCATCVRVQRGRLLIVVFPTATTLWESWQGTPFEIEGGGPCA